MAKKCLGSKTTCLYWGFLFSKNSLSFWQFFNLFWCKSFIDIPYTFFFLVMDKNDLHYEQSTFTHKKKKIVKSTSLKTFLSIVFIFTKHILALLFRRRWCFVTRRKPNAKRFLGWSVNVIAYIIREESIF